jgi:hypothetical protein
MKKVSFSIALFSITLLLNSCGGVIGNIEKYPFPKISSDTLKKALNNIYTKYPELKKSDTTLYGNNNGEDFYYLISSGKQKIVFKCHAIASQQPYDEEETELSLTTAAIWGETMKLAPEMGFFEKRKYRSLFEESILPKIKAELK